MQNLCHDVRYGLWMLAKNPGFTAIDAAWSDAGVGDCVVFGVLHKARRAMRVDPLVALRDE